MRSRCNSLDVLNYSIRDILSDVVKRQYFFVYPDENVYMASVCLIPAIEAYVDGVVVVKDNKPLGVIGSRDVLSGYSKIGKDVFYNDASTIMYEVNEYVNEDASLIEVINYFRYKKIGFAPIIKHEKVIAVLSFRDIIRLIAKFRLDTKVREICSKLITVDPNLTVGNALVLMLTKGVRRVIVKTDHEYSISGRDILGFLMENEFGEKRYKKPLDAPLVHVSKHKLAKITADKSISETARLIMIQKAPPSLLVSSSYIVTPWDLIQKGLRLNMY